MFISTQIVISIHTADRPLRRAIESVLSDSQSGVVVVAHNIDPTLLDIPDDDRVMVINHIGNNGMPGAPCNTGLEATTAAWVGKLDSDDLYQPGAIAAMRERARNDGADAVIPAVFKQGKRNKTWIPTLRSSNLEASRDGLFYQTAPFGIFKRSALLNRVRFREDLPSGEDIRVSADLWTADLSVSHYPQDPAYIITDDAPSRATSARYPLELVGLSWTQVWDERFICRWNSRTRQAFGTKIARLNLLKAIHDLQLDGSDVREEEFKWLVQAVARLRSEAPTFDNPLAKSQTKLIRSVEHGELPPLSSELMDPNQLPLRPWCAVTEPDSAFRYRVKNFIWNKRQSKGRDFSQKSAY